MKSFLPAIVGTIKRSAETVAEGADAVKDLLANDNALEQIPVFSAAVKTLKIKDVWVQQRLERNCRAFFEAVEGADVSKVEEMRMRLEADPEHLSDFTDTVVSVLIEGEKPIKAQLIGHLVLALSAGSISLEQFQALSQIVQAGSTTALNAFKAFLDGNSKKLYRNSNGIEEEPLIVSLGLGTRFGSSFRVSDLGASLYKYGFNGQLSAFQDEFPDPIDGLTQAARWGGPTGGELM